MDAGSDHLGQRYNQLYSGTAADTRAVTVDGWPRDRNQALVYLARPGGRLLEIGCGTGAVLGALGPFFGQIVGVELSAVRAEQARRSLADVEHCTIVSESLERLAALIDEPFDCIVWADVIEHVVDVIEAMRVISTLSREGTQLITVTPNAAYLPQRLRVVLGHALSTSLPSHRNEGFAVTPSDTVLLDGGHLHYFTFRQIEILYQVAGFRPTRRLGFGGRLSRLRHLWPNLLSGAVCVSGIYQRAGVQV